MPHAPAPGSGGWFLDRAPVIGETLVAGGGRLGDDRVRPVVVGHERLGDLTAPGAGQAARVEEDPEPLQRTALPIIGDVPVGLQWCPVARGRGEIPDGAAGSG